MTKALLLLFFEGGDMGYGLLISLLGMAAVFVILTLFIFVIKLLSWVTDSIKEKVLEKANVPVAPIKVEQINQGELKLINCSERDAALIMAIVADNCAIPLEKLRFNSIKLIEEEKGNDLQSKA